MPFRSDERQDRGSGRTLRAALWIWVAAATAAYLYQFRALLQAVTRQFL